MEPEDLSSERKFFLDPQPRASTQPAWLLLLLILSAVAALVALIGGVLLLITLLHTFPVTLIADGSTSQFQMHSDTVAGLLKTADIALDAGDLISPPLDSPLEGNMVVRIERARSVFLMVDGETTPLWTPLTSPADILASANVTVGSDDHIQIDGTDATPDELATWSVPVSMIVVRHAVTLRVHDDDGTQTIRTTGATVGDALFAAGITLYLTDTTTPDLSTPLTNNMDVTITRAHPVDIIADGSTIRTRTLAKTVAEALADANVALVGMDYAIPAESTPVQPGMSIRVIRVREEVEAQQQSIPFETVYQADPDLELDHRQVTQAGQTGTEELRVRVRYENGTAISRSETDTVVTQAPVNRVVHYGTKVVIRTVDTPDGPRDYWRVLRMYVTSYHPVNGDNTTATGHTLQKGIVGSDPTILPYGTQVYVQFYGVGEVQDTGPRRTMPLWIDLGYSEDDYRGWHGYYDVYILTPVPPNIDYMLPGT